MNAEYFYPLYKTIDKRAFNFLSKIANKRNYPKLLGTSQEFNELFKLLVYSGKIKDYRKLRDVLIREFRNGVVNVSKVVTAGRKIKIPKGVDASWAVFKQDQRICELLDEFAEARLEFKGTQEEKLELLKRYILSQFLQDWRGPKLAVAIESLKAKQIKVQDLSRVLRTWDFTTIFDEGPGPRSG